MNNFDLVIIGGGAGAFGAAIKASELGAKTAMINSGLPLGGTCVNVGCVPSKNLIHAAEIVHKSEKHNFAGIEIDIKGFDFQKLIASEISLVEKLRKEKYEKVLASLDKVTFVEGKAEFISNNKVSVNGSSFKGDKFIIATGSSTTVPPIDNIKETGYITHIEALKLTKQPEELVIVGAGPLGLEFAQMYSRFGTKVTLLEYMPSIFSTGEPDLVQKLQDILIEEGIDIYTCAKVKRTNRTNGKKSIVYEIDGIEYEVSADEILLATGRTANTKYLGLEKAMVEVSKNKAIAVDDYFATSHPDIFAVGDVADLPLRLETTAGKEGTLAAENALNGSKKSIDYNTVPFTIFTDPQYSSVGWTEERQMQKTGVCACRTVSMEDVPKAQVVRNTKGLIKMGIDPNTKHIVGVHALLPNSSDIVSQAMVLLRNKNTIDDVLDTLPVFPSFSEAIKIAALSFTKDISNLSCCV